MGSTYAFQTGAKTIATWLGGIMNDPSKTRFVDGKTAPASLIRIVLMHTSTAGEKEVDSVGISGAYDDERIAELAKRFLGKADADAQGLNGRQQYLLYPFYEGTDEPQGRLPFHRNGHIINESGDHSTEPPTPEGRFAQRMRHDEGYSQVLMAATANIINQQNRLIELQGSHLERAKNENVMMFDKLRDMAMQAALATHEHTMREIAAKRNAALVEGAVKLAPAFINKITGAEIVPHGTADTAILEALAGAITEDDLATLGPVIGKLPPAVVGLVMDRLTQLAQQREAKKDALATAISESGETLSRGAADNEFEH